VSNTTDQKERRPAPTPARKEATEALLDAAERLLIQVGHAGVTTRAVAGEAGVNHGLVHYYFGSIEELMLQVLERFSRRLLERQRAMYAADRPFIEKWRSAMSFLDDDRRGGFPKVKLELQALSWNNAILRERLLRVHREWIDTLTPAFERGMRELGLESPEFSVEAIVALVVTFNEGIELERESDMDSGHRTLLDAIDAWLTRLDRATRTQRRGGSPTLPKRSRRSHARTRTR
jgi:AcrR family transcriptional regulator